MKEETVCALCGILSSDALVVLEQPICRECEDAISRLTPYGPGYLRWLHRIKQLWNQWA